MMNWTPNFDFMGKRRIAEILSGLLVVGSLAAIFINGLNLGIDFTGGVLLEVEYAGEANLAEIREALTGAGFESPLVQNFGTVSDALVRLAPQEGQEGGEIRDRVLEALQARDPSVELRR
ncbi:MAG TPA: protein translocase subunit SecF, partial [Gammaproteobacteria bacterium]|nr:protein translocase subunit SecF [Gammaproteobacteria bacterium]